VPGPDSVSPDALRRVALLQGLSDEVLGDVAQACRFKRYRARQELIARDDVDRDCFFVLSGRLRVIAWSPGGREVSFRDVDAGETIGEMAAIDGRPRSASVVALTETLVARLNPETLLDLLRRHWPICERMLQHLAASARGLTERVYELSTLNVQQRLCAELLRHSLTMPETAGQAVLQPPPGHSELAARIGCAREQVTRGITELEQLGLVERGEGRLTIVDLHALAERVESRRGSA
jgi:CRP-like cAMP-binding protein